MRARPLPENPSLEQLTREAERLAAAVCTGEAEALAMLRDLDEAAKTAVAGFAVEAAQQVLARSYGFSSWTELKRHLEVVARFAWDPPRAWPDASGTLPPPERLVRLGCLSYGAWHPSLVEQARRMLERAPELSRTDLYSAATVGDAAAARAMLDRDPALVSRKGGGLGWEPLLYTCYSRLVSPDPTHSTLEVARLLLEAGADPNAGFLWRGNVPPFTALTGAFGEGEDGSNQPPHPHRDALARLLLEAGADPNDGQTLYNRHFRPDDGHLELLFSHGLGRDKGGPWYERLGERLQSPVQLLSEELWAAARMSYVDRVKLLVEHGAPVDRPGLRDGRTPYEAALFFGNLEIADYLVSHGARPVEVPLQDRFAAACLAGRRDDAHALLRQDPTLLEAIGRPGRLALVHRAVEANRLEGVRLLAELGCEISGLTPHDGVGVSLNTTPLHNAAWSGHLDMVRLLVELGADPNARESSYHATALGWARHNHQDHVVEYLLSLATIFDAVQCGAVERVAELLAADPSLARARDGDGVPLAFFIHAGHTDVDAMLALLLAHGLDLNARHPNGQSLLDLARKRGEDDFARVLRRHGARTAADDGQVAG